VHIRLNLFFGFFFFFCLEGHRFCSSFQRESEVTSLQVCVIRGRENGRILLLFLGFLGESVRYARRFFCVANALTLFIYFFFLIFFSKSLSFCLRYNHVFIDKIIFFFHLNCLVQATKKSLGSFIFLPLHLCSLVYIYILFFKFFYILIFF